MPETVGYEVSDAVATVTLNRPDALNALNVELKEALRDALAAAAADESVRAVLLTGTGRAFCVGQDLREHATALQERSNAEVWQTVPQHYVPIARALATMPKPVVAAVNGVAAGAGASIACACDFRVVADSAAFTFAFTAIGLSADTGATWTLPRLVGAAKALELLMLPGTVSAEEALALGLATKVAPVDEVVDAARELAVRLARGPTVAYGALRHALAFSAAHPLEESLDFEGHMMALAGGTADHRDAVAAFLRKEQPTFTGR